MVCMDSKKSDKGLKKSLVAETVRRPVVQTERSNGVAAHRTRIREVSSRYMSNFANAPSIPKRCPSPVPRSTTTSASTTVPKRAVSAERKRPSTPTSPSRPSTPVLDVDMSLGARKIALTKQSENLWPSTMRSLSVSFQADRILTAQKEKSMTRSLFDTSLRLPSNVSHKQPESPRSFRKETPERRVSPLKGKSLIDQAENSKPADSSHARFMDQHRWPSRMGGKVSSGSLNRSVDFTDKIIRHPSATLPRIGIPSSRRVSDGVTRPMYRTSSEASAQIPPFQNSVDRKRPEGDLSLDIHMLKLPELRKPPPFSSSDRSTLSSPVARSQSLPSSRQPSPVRMSRQPKVSSPSHSRPSTPTTRGLSPSRIRPLNSSSQSMSSASVLSFISDFRNPWKNNQLEDAHQLRLLYNRHLQWRYANARADFVMRNQRVTTEISLKNVWRTNLILLKSVVEKRIRVQQMRLELNLYSMLNEQLRYLGDWTSFENDYNVSLTGIINDLEASTLRLPLIGGARADVKSLKIAIGSAMDVMQSMGPSVITLLSRAEGINTMVSRLADLAVREKALLDECETLLTVNAAVQVEESSFQTHLIQTYTSIDKY